MDIMKKFIALAALLYSSLATADIFWFLRNTDGSTNWQYVANYSSGILIIAVSITAIRLFFSRRQAHRYNTELEEIRTQLELRVKERTANLEAEIVEHILQRRLAVVKITVHRQRMYVGFRGRGHLAALDLGYATVREQNEHINVFQPTECFDRG